MADIHTFSVGLRLPDDGSETTLKVTHQDETFITQFQGKSVALINNGDNSWSQVQGDTPQEYINIIGEAIEKHYQQQSL